MIKPLLLSFLLLNLSTLPFSILPVYATDTATSSPEIDPELIKENIKKRIDKVVATNSIDLYANKSPLRGWVGIIESLTGDSITIHSNDESRIVSISDTTTIVRTLKNKRQSGINPEDLAINDTLLSMGRIDDSGLMDAIKLESFEVAPPKITKTVVFGTIDNIDPQSSTFDIVTSTGNRLALTHTKTSLLSQASTLESLALAELSDLDQVIAIYEPASANTNTFNLLILKRMSAPQSTPEPTPSPAL